MQSILINFWIAKILLLILSSFLCFRCIIVTAIVFIEDFSFYFATWNTWKLGFSTWSTRWFCNVCKYIAPERTPIAWEDPRSPSVRAGLPKIKNKMLPYFLFKLPFIATMSSGHQPSWKHAMFLPEWVKFESNRACRRRDLQPTFFCLKLTDTFSWSRPRRKSDGTFPRPQSEVPSEKWKSKMPKC